MRILHVATLFTLFVALANAGGAEELEIASLRELADVAEQSDQVIRMKPGVYLFTEYMTHDDVARRRKSGDFTFMQFSGNNNRLDLSGVTIEFDVSIQGIGRPPVHTNEFVFSGDGNTIIGLTIKNVGEGVSPGGAVLSCTGDKNTFKPSS